MSTEQATCVCLFVWVHGAGVFGVCESCEQWPVFVTVDNEVLLIVLILVSHLLTREKHRHIQQCASLAHINGVQKKRKTRRKRDFV